MKRVPFVSQMGRGEKSEYYGCGVASLMMLLKYRNFRDEFGRPPCYKTLARELRAYIPPQNKGIRNPFGIGVYPQDVKNWLRGRDLLCKIWVRRNPEKRNEPFSIPAALPIMVGMYGEKRWGECGHWIVCTRATAREVEYLDPQYKTRKVRSMSRKDFFKEWDGNAVGILGAVS